MRNGSKLMLGTAQLGTKYGIANVAGMPSIQTSCELIKYAVTSGIGYLDTAPGYGESEKMIGDCLNNLHLNSKPVIVTKLPSVQVLGFKTEEERKSFVYSSITSSLKNLKRSSLEMCLLHDPMDMTYQKGEIIKILSDLKQRRLIHKIGVSVYNPQDIEMYLNLGCFDSIQVPINLFDQRLIRNGMLEKLSEKGIEVFVRSIYLQGLLLMAPEDLPDKLKQAKKPLELLSKFSEETGISIKEFSFLFVRDLPGVSKIIIGCETIDQLKENLTMMELPPLKKEMIKEICQLFIDIPIKIIDPRMWK
ncbi:aldo/keto reductase [Paenibacillus albidus]|uniref:aldo/keto reductase n=1 Tax=Paenibacillus albidus TaxID=2041023 RepID=UPI001BE83411|nr:aldo/keto reductase [Paenibacillus albidus]MBT2288401.1 aldo/keto reductase [Paenibacillus albidus]